MNKETMTKEEHISQGDSVYPYANGDYSWGKEGIQHLIRNEEEIAHN